MWVIGIESWGFSYVVGVKGETLEFAVITSYFSIPALFLFIIKKPNKNKSQMCFQQNLFLN